MPRLKRICRMTSKCTNQGMRVVWAPGAQQYRDDIWNYIAAENLHAPVDMDELFS